MAKRRRGGFNEFLDGFNGTYSIGKKIAGDIVDAQAGAAAKSAAVVTNPEDTAAVQDYQAAAKGIADGTVGDGGMTPEERATASAAYANAAQTGTKFYLGRGDGNMGQAFDTAPTPQQQRLAGVRAMESTYTGAGDQEKALKWGAAADQQESGIQQQELTGMQITKAKSEEALRLKTADWLKGSNFGRLRSENEKQMADYMSAKKNYESRIQSGENPAAIGLPPQQPKPKTIGFAESINDSLSFMSLEAEHGKYDPAKWEAMAGKMEKVKNESYDKALRLADSGAPMQKIAEAFAESGESKFNIKDVVADRMGTTMIRGVQVPTRIISIKGTPDIIVASELSALGDSERILSTHFAVNQDKRSANADARGASAEGRAIKSEARSMAKDEEAKAKEKHKLETSIALFKEKNPGASAAQIEAVRSGVMSALPKEVTNEYSFAQNPLGMGGTRVNKNTGQIETINEKGQVVSSVPAPGSEMKKPAKTLPGWGIKQIK